MDILLISILVFLIILSIIVAILRWVFRIDKIVKLLEEIKENTRRSK